MATVHIPKYEVKQEIGSGGMATVYLAVDKLLDREVALKVMSPAIASTKGFQDGFIREARIVAKLDHPNIVKIYDVGVESSQYYMAMEYLPKGTLKQRLAMGKLPVTETVLIVRQLASALSYAHQKGYVHRDIKPANILFRENGEITLADFGIAKLQGTSTDMTQMGFITGTPHYMSPEQATGQNIDQRSDLYSLGVVFYEMLAGKKPFTGGNALAIAYEHMHKDLPRLEGDVTIFQPVVDKALAKKPDERFASIDVFSEALAEISRSEDATLIVPGLTGTIEARTYLPPPSKMSKWVLGSLIMAGMTLGGGYYVVLDMKKKELEVKEQADQINNHLTLAKAGVDRERLFNHTTWSEGCKQLLEDTAGPYETTDSAEWHYHQIIGFDPENETAKQALAKLENKKTIEYSTCDQYQRDTRGDNSEVNGMFAK